MCPSPPPYDDLDPGIRELVRFLNDHGFVTTDSGDGRSKFGPGGPEGPEGDAIREGGVMDVAHVVLRCQAESIAETCDRLREVLLGIGVPLDVIGPEADTPCIQGTYDPSDAGREGFVILSSVDSSALPQR